MAAHTLSWQIHAALHLEHVELTCQTNADSLRAVIIGPLVRLSRLLGPTS